MGKPIEFCLDVMHRHGSCTVRLTNNYLNVLATKWIQMTIKILVKAILWQEEIWN